MKSVVLVNEERPRRLRRGINLNLFVNANVPRRGEFDTFEKIKKAM